MQLEALKQLSDPDQKWLDTLKINPETGLPQVKSCQLLYASLNGLRTNDIEASACTHPGCMDDYGACTQDVCDNNPGYQTTQQEIVASSCIYPLCLDDPKECSLRGCN